MSNDIESTADEVYESPAPEPEAAAVAVPPELEADDGDDDGIVDAEPAAAPRAGRPADAQQLQRIVEGALMAAGKPLAVSDLGELFEADDRPAADEIRAALAAIAEQCAGRGFELREVASGFRFQVVQEVAPWVGRLWEEKPQKYSRALLETLALIAYRQPITRGDIEDIRGVAVASNIVKTLLEREWVRVVGHKDVPGRPALYATTRKFLDYFNLKNLDELPPLAELRDLDSLNAELALEGVDTPPINDAVDDPDAVEAEPAAAADSADAAAAATEAESTSAAPAGEAADTANAAVADSEGAAGADPAGADSAMERGH